MYPALMSFGMFGLVIVSGFNFSTAMDQMAVELAQQRRDHPHLS